MKAIRYLGANKLELQDVPCPETPSGWARIKVSHSGICGTDLNIYGGGHPRAQAPLTMGHEFSGTLENDVDRFKSGAPVTIYPLISCGTCLPCLSGNAHVCNTLGLYGIDKDGGMAEYALVPRQNVVPLPDALPFALGTLVEPIAVAVHTLRETGFMPGDDALVFGAGTIGLCVAIALRRFGAREVIVVENDRSRLALASGLGFKTVDPAQTDVVAFSAEKTNGNGFDRVYDCAGAASVAFALLDVVRVRGQIVIVASYKKPAEMPLFKGMAKETSIHFVRVYRVRDVEIAVGLALCEPLFGKIITHVLPAERAQEGFDLMLTKGSGACKVMFKFD
uniref:Threonine dehydrogenase n=1 Tax=uncultured bacterium contig00097 TaxID=1181566 RepID=A0A806KK77_9BACT|nr:threonine dehydrogenase [uncultured bacterium contig00097]